jgi:hypothetical protein
MLCSVKGSVHGSITDLIKPKKRRNFQATKLKVTEAKTQQDQNPSQPNL